MEKKILIERHNIDKYIVENLSLNNITQDEIRDANYHHNSNYDNALLILKYGILSLKRMHELGINKLTKYQMELLSDTSSHINGIEGISLSKVGLEDLYSGEEEYNPFSSQYIDFIISDRVKTRRFTQHYGNEFVTFNDIPLSDIKSLDFRIIKYIEENIKNSSTNKDKVYSDLIYMYNTILQIARQIKSKNLQIQMREMSSEQLNLNIDSLYKMPILIMEKPHM